MTERGGSIDPAYELEDRPPAVRAVFLGVQHVAAMIVPATAVALIVGGSVGRGSGDTSFLVRTVLVFPGLATLVQVFPIGPVGARLPVVTGTSFAFVGAATTLVTSPHSKLFHRPLTLSTMPFDSSGIDDPDARRSGVEADGRPYRRGRRGP